MPFIILGVGRKKGPTREMSVEEEDREGPRSSPFGWAVWETSWRRDQLSRV